MTRGTLTAAALTFALASPAVRAQDDAASRAAARAAADVVAQQRQIDAIARQLEASQRQAIEDQRRIDRLVAAIDDDAAARVAAAQKRLAERQAAAKKASEAAASAQVKPASRPATVPVVDGPKRSDRVVFLLDLSGTAASNGRSWESRAAIGRAVALLGGKQAYAILIACHGGAVYPKNATMLGATPPNLELSTDFLRDFTGGGADGLAAGFERAAALRPDVVWVLTDGDFTDGVPIAEAAKRLRATGARINSSLVGASDLATAKQLALIYEMAADNGGICVDDDGRRLDFLPAKSRDPRPADNEHPADLPDLAKGPNVLKE